MRGQQLFQGFFSNPDVDEAPSKLKKGRNQGLAARRTKLLLYRYYYYGKFTELRYESIITNLQEEFFLSEIRIQDIISQNVTQIQQIRKEAPTVKDLQAKFSNWIWK